MSTLRETLVERLWPVRSGLGQVRAGALIVGGAWLIALSAKAQVPFYPVPMTLQTLVVLVIGAVYGARLATATLAVYLAEGFAGLPVFAGPAAGPAYIMGPTGGFLLGFLVAAALVGHLASRGGDRSTTRLVAVMALGHLAIFVFGYAWLATAIGAGKAWSLGVAPFYVATLLKTLLAATLVRAVGWVARGLP